MVKKRRRKKLTGVVATAAAAVVMAGTPMETRAAWVDEPILCERITCVDGSTFAGNATSDVTVRLSCGDGSGDIVSGVKFASFGLAEGTCPGVNDQEFDDANVTLEVNQACHFPDTAVVVEDACLNKESCELTLAQAFQVGDPQGGGCPTTFDEMSFKVHVDCGQPVDVLQLLISGVVALIGLGMGASTNIESVKLAVRERKRALLVGILCQFGVMPLYSFIMASALQVTPLVAVSMIVVGCSPGGSTSNLFTKFAHGDIALSIAMSAFSTAMSIFMMPLLVSFYGETLLGLDGGVAIPVADIFTALLLVVVPASLGLGIRIKAPPKVADFVAMVGSGLGVLFILAALITGIKEDSRLLDITARPNIWLTAILLEPVGCLVGFQIAKLLRLPEDACRAVSLEVGVQNTTLSMAVMIMTYRERTCDLLNVMPYALVASLCYIFHSIWITWLLRRRKVDGSAKIYAAEVPPPAAKKS